MIAKNMIPFLVRSISVNQCYQIDKVFGVTILRSASVQCVQKDLNGSHFVLLEVEIDFFSSFPVRLLPNQHPQNLGHAHWDKLFSPNDAIRANKLN